MSFTANWSVSGANFDKSADAFIQSAKYVTQTKNLKKYESALNKSFKEHLDYNIRRAGIEADNLSDVFFMKINSNSISFVNTEPIITQRYEYGYYNGSNDTNEEYYEEYMFQTSPQYFIRPAINQSMNEVGKLMLEEAKKEYEQTQRYYEG